MKARIKSFEEMPAYVKCCEDSNEMMKLYTGTEVELDLILKKVSSTCPYCGTSHTVLGFHYKYEPFTIGQDMIDIDEGVLQELVKQ